MAAFNPGKYVFQPRPLQQFDFGAGFLDLANARAENRRLAEQKRSAEATLSQRQSEQRDTNSLNAATFARDDANTQLKTATDKYAQRAKLADAGRSAIQSGDQAGWAALEPSLREAGIKVTYDALGNPSIENGEAPTRAPLNIQGARSTIYGGGAPTMGQPIQVPGFGADGQRNPMDRLPGASAAALGQQPALPPVTPVSSPPVPPPPAPGSAEADLATVTAMSSPDEEETAPATLPTGATPPVAPAPAAPDKPSDPALASLDPESAAMAVRLQREIGQATPDATGDGNPAGVQNPMNPPAFSPYRIDLAQVRARNQSQMAPFQQALKEGSPVDFQGRADAFNRGIANSGMSPELVTKYSTPLLEQLTGMYRSEKTAELAAGRLGNARDRQSDVKAQKDSDTFYKRKDIAFKNGRNLLKDNNLSKLREKIQAVRAASAQAEKASVNPNAASSLVSLMHRMVETGVVTDNDYKNTREGIRNMASSFIHKLKTEVTQGEGLLPDVVEDMVEVVHIAEGALKRQVGEASEGLFNSYEAAKDPGTRAGYADSIRGNLPDMKEFWPSGVDQEPTEYGESRAGPPAGDRLGVSPLPKTLDGKGGGKKQSAKSRVDAVLNKKKANASP